MSLQDCLAPGGPTLILVGGKGGVGKTTVACAAAMAVARAAPEKRILLASTDPAHSIGDALDLALGPEPSVLPVPGHLSGLEISGEKLLARFILDHGESLRTLIARGTYLKDSDLVPFFEHSLPGLDEVMAVLTLARQLVSGNVDRVIVDTAPTGHTLRLLGLPDAMTRWVSYLGTLQAKHRYLSTLYAGSVRKDEAEDFLDDLTHQLTSLKTLLADPSRCRFITVTIAEPMSLNETERLVAALADLRMPLGPVLVNRRDRISSCEACQARSAAQAQVLSIHPGLTAAGESFVIPRFFREPHGLVALDAVASYLSGVPPGANESAGGQDASPGVEEPAAPAEAGPDDVSLSLPAPVPPLPDMSRIVMFGGKGGVGKTTMASLYATEYVRRHPGKRVLVFSTDPAHSLADFFEQPVGDAPVPVPEHSGLWVQSIDPAVAFSEIKDLYRQEFKRMLRSFTGRKGVDLPYDRAALSSLLDFAPPGVDEMMALCRLADHLRAGTYDLHVLDTAPTGHTLRFLELPDLAISWLRSFFALLLRYRSVLQLPMLSESMVDISKKLHEIAAVLHDASLCRFVAVTVPTRVAIAETTKLLKALRAASITCHALFVNQVPGTSRCPTCSGRARESCRILGDLRARSDLPPVALAAELPGPVSLTSAGPRMDALRDLVSRLTGDAIASERGREMVPDARGEPEAFHVRRPHGNVRAGHM